jgi:hypothetical protein
MANKIILFLYLIALPVFIIPVFTQLPAKYGIVTILLLLSLLASIVKDFKKIKKA